jgi:uncharacterized protein (TIGR04562 family)
VAIVDELFPWETLSAILGGRSSIDIPRLQLSDVAQAEGFLDCYGFRWDEPHHRRELEVFRQQALGFLQGELLTDEPDLALPTELREEDDVRRLLLLASGDTRAPSQQWACAVLRVMHTLAHSSSYFNERFGPEIRAQVLGRIETHLVRGDEGLWLGRGEDAVPLLDFQVKEAKSTRSVLMKLLHKPENVATDIFDRLGVRFVTRERFDVLRVVRYLRVNNVVMFANLKPSRSRNSLIDLEALHDELLRLGQSPGLSRADVFEELRHWTAEQPLPPGGTHFNLYSSIDYHAVQFTCRQLIRVPNPFSNGHARAPEPEVEGEPRRLFGNGPELRFFFPFEVQVLDVGSYTASRTGLAAHDEYKARQRETVKRRVLGYLLRRQPPEEP